MHATGLAAPAGTPRLRKWRTWPAEEIGRARVWRGRRGGWRGHSRSDGGHEIRDLEFLGVRSEGCHVRVGGASRVGSLENSFKRKQVGGRFSAMFRETLLPFICSPRFALLCSPPFRGSPVPTSCHPRSKVRPLGTPCVDRAIFTSHLRSQPVLIVLLTSFPRCKFEFLLVSQYISTSCLFHLFT